MHEEVEIAPDGENGNDHEYGTNEEPEPDARPAKETKKLIRRNGPRSPRNAARIANAIIPPLTLPLLPLRPLLPLFPLFPLLPFLPLLHLLPLLPLLLNLIQTPTLPTTARTRARRSSK